MDTREAQGCIQNVINVFADEMSSTLRDNAGAALADLVQKALRAEQVEQQDVEIARLRQCLQDAEIELGYIKATVGAVGGQTAYDALKRFMQTAKRQSDSYDMALLDIGKIGAALGLNPNRYMTHSPEQVAGMVLERAKEGHANAKKQVFDQVYSMFNTMRGDVQNKYQVMQTLDVARPYILGEKP